METCATRVPSEGVPPKKSARAADPIESSEPAASGDPSVGGEVAEPVSGVDPALPGAGMPPSGSWTVTAPSPPPGGACGRAALIPDDCSPTVLLATIEKVTKHAAAITAIASPARGASVLLPGTSYRLHAERAPPPLATSCLLLVFKRLRSVTASPTKSPYSAAITREDATCSAAGRPDPARPGACNCYANLLYQLARWPREPRKRKSGWWPAVG
jgi:hypothetical protein